MIITDWETWLLDFGDEFRLDVYKKSNEEVREAILVNAVIRESIELPDKDILIGFIEIPEYESEDDKKSPEIMHYYKLSDIELVTINEESKWYDEEQDEEQ